MKQNDPTLDMLVRDITQIMATHDTDVCLAALNYCMGGIIAHKFHGDERALRVSDQQTRFVAQTFNDKNDRLN